ncbi:hypothetical protein ACFX2A_024817 [Malus domestica]
MKQKKPTKNRIVFTSFSTNNVSVVLSRVFTATVRTGRFTLSQRRERHEVDGNDDEDVDFRSAKEGSVRVAERETRSEVELEP